MLGERREAPEGRPWVLLNMVTSVDGATAASGRSGGLGSPADRQVFHALRAIADVVVAGAGTVRAEHYGPPRVTPELQQWRRSAGRPHSPGSPWCRAASRSTWPTPSSPRPRCAPSSSPSTAPPTERLAATREVAEVVLAGSAHVDLGSALDQLHALGARTVLVEGGPTLNGQLVAADLVDEVCLTLSPALVGGASHRFAVGEGQGGFTPLRLDRVLADGDHLFLRYVRAGAA